MEIKLSGVTLVSFMEAKEGDLLEIKKKSPRSGEFRFSTGPPAVSYLVYKDKTKIGVIPRKIMAKYEEPNLKKNCRVIKIDKDTNTIVVEI